MNDFSRFVRETSAEKNSFCSADNIIINVRFLHRYCQGIICRRKTDARINNLSLIGLPHDFAFSNKSADPLTGDASVIFCLGSCEYIRVMNGLYGWFSAGIPIFEHDRKVLILGWCAAAFDIAGADPCSLRSHEIVPGNLSILSGSGGLFSRRINQLGVGLYNLVSLVGSRSHLIQLAAEYPPTGARENDSQENEENRNHGQPYIYLFISIIMGCLSILCIAKGLNFGSYLGAALTLLGLPLVAVGVYCFISGFLNLPFP